MHIFMFFVSCHCSVSVSPPHRAPASSSWTPGTRPPRRWPSCWWPLAQTDAPPLSLWPISETNVSNHRKSFRVLFEKHAVPSVTICLCVCSDLLCFSLLLSLLSSLSFLPSLWDSAPGGRQQSWERLWAVVAILNEWTKFVDLFLYSDVNGLAWWELIHCREKFSLNIYLYDKLMSLVGTWRETHQVHINTNNYKYGVKKGFCCWHWIALSHATDRVQSSPVPGGEERCQN